MLRNDRPKAVALQPAQNKVNVNGDTRHQHLAELKSQTLSLKEQQLSALDNNHQNNKQHALIKDKLGDVIGKIHLNNKKQSENDNCLKQVVYASANDEESLRQQTLSKEPSPPRLRLSTRTTRASAKLLQQHQQRQQQSQATENKAKLDEDVSETKTASNEMRHNLKSSSEPSSSSSLATAANTNATLSSALSNVVSRIPRLSRAPAHFNLLNLIPHPKSIETDYDQDKQIQIHDEQDEVEMEEDIIDIDKSSSTDALFLCCDYVSDIYDYLREVEQEQMIYENFLKDQKIYTPKHRQRLINWCIETHSDLNLSQETLYITVATIDRFFQFFNVTKQDQVQLVALGAIMIASKYEEIYPPSVDDLVYKSHGSYTKREIFKVEISILKTLKFDLGRPIPLSFLRRFSRAAQFDLRMHNIAKYLLELTLTEYECAHWRPSLLAATAVFVVLNLNSGSSTRISKSCDKVWNRTLVHYTTYEKKQLMQPAVTLCKILKKSYRLPSSFSCIKKHSNSLLKWPELSSSKVDQLIKNYEK